MCDCLVALAPATDCDATLFAKNSDRPPTERQRLTWSPSRPPGTPVRTTYLDVAGSPAPTVPALLVRPAWMWGAEHGVNAAGVAAGNETIYTTLDPRPFPPALTGMDLVRLVLERAGTAADGVDVLLALLDRYGQGGSGHEGADRPYWSSFLVADPRRAFVVETSGREAAVDEVSPAAPVRAISNRTTIPAFDVRHRHPRQPVERLVDPRLAASRAVLADRPVRAQGLRDHLSGHAGGAGGWTVCMHVPPDGSFPGEETRSSLVAELADGRPPRVWLAAGSPCRVPYIEVPFGPEAGEGSSW